MKTIFSFLFFLFFLLSSTFVEAQWQKQTNGLPDTWNLGWAIDASDSNNAIITVGLFTGTGLFKTTDGGDLWFQLQLPDTINEPIIDISMPDPSHIWAATDLGKIIASTDGGQSWIIQFNDASKTGFMNYIEMFDNLNGVAMGDAPLPNQNKPALFLKTTNGGIDWNESTDSTLLNVWSGDTWRRLDFVDPMHGYFYESGINPQKLYRTVDGCTSWTATTYSGSPTIIKCYDENTLITYSNYNAKISVTKDGGITWNEVPFIGGWGEDFEFISGDAAKIYFADEYDLFFSSDTGSNWTNILVDTIDLQGRDIVFTNENHGWLLCDNGNLYHTTNGGVIVDVNENRPSIPTKLNLSQNYPNPFNPVTRINYSIPTSPFNLSPYKSEGHKEWLVTLKVYDILGNEITTLVNEEKPAGSYKVNFDASKLSSGIYFYRLQVADLKSSSGQGFIQAKKMMLIK